MSAAGTKTTPLRCGFVPLVDAAPLLVAQALGFAREEGLSLELARFHSWAALRDKLAFGALDCAHMLAPVPVASAMGLACAWPLDVLMVLSINGATIGVSKAVARTMGRIRPLGAERAGAIGDALLASRPEGLTIGAPFPYASHTFLLRRWLGDDQRYRLATIPPPRMAAAVAAGEIDAFCVGEPYGSLAVEAGAAELISMGAAIWSFAPEKALAARRGWAEANPALAAALMRAVYRAARWVADPRHRLAVSEILARPEHLDLPSTLLDRALTGRLALHDGGEATTTPRFVVFHEGLANFPWRSQALWFARAIAAREGIEPAAAARAARRCFRTDLYRRHLGPIGAPLPGASEKVEGALASAETIACRGGEAAIGPDRFFDGAVFDPAAFDER